MWQEVQDQERYDSLSRLLNDNVIIIMAIKPRIMGWIVQLRSPRFGARYYMARGKGVTLERSKAKVFATKEEAAAKAKECDLWRGAKAVPL